MARGRAAAGKAKAKRKADAKEEATPAKLQRADSGNSGLRQAITEVKEQAIKEKKNKTYKPDTFLLIEHPKASVHEDYSCMLNQTNIGNNNNKFYVIQVVQVQKKFICFTRWGRVGETGQFNSAVEKNVDEAIKSFKKKFKDKTKNDWDNKENFTPQKGKYTLIEIDDDDDDDGDNKDDDDDAVDGGHKATKEMVPFTGICPLHDRTILLIKIILSDDMFLNQMSHLKLDIKKMPLGKLSKVQIAKGLEALLDIEAAINNNEPNDVLMELSSKFYTHCPHDFGRMKPPVLNTPSIIQQKKEVMMTLSDIELAQSLQKQKAEQTVHPILEKYQKLGCEIELLDKKSDLYKMLEAYSKASHKSSYWSAKLLDIWQLDRKGEKDRFEEHDTIKHRKLLWHGTNVAVVAAILNSGLRIMPHSGGRVGKGIYFASEHSKSAGYVSCHYGDFEGENNVGFMFLVEVALGKEKNITNDNSSLTKAPKGFDSVVARGTTEPDPKKDEIVDLEGKQVIVPVGQPLQQKQFKQSSFSQSEYLVYNESQARLRYLLKFSFE